MVIAHTNSLFNSASYYIEPYIIDPGDTWEAFTKAKAVLLTHAHFDHIYGLNKLLESNPDVVIYTNEYGAEMLMDSKKNMSKYHESPFVLSNNSNIELISDNQIVNIDGVDTKAIFTPGHNPSCITWLCNDYLFTGDAYIPGIKTVTNLPGSDKQLAEQSILKIKQLSKGKLILPGHSIINDAIKH